MLTNQNYFTRSRAFVVADEFLEQFHIGFVADDANPGEQRPEFSNELSKAIMYPTRNEAQAIKATITSPEDADHYDFSVVEVHCDTRAT